MTKQGPLEVPTLVDVLCAALREQILTSQIPAGSRLTEMGIAARFSVARPTAKAAMERLVHGGLLRRSTNKSAQVPLLEVADVDDLYYSRRFIEKEVAAELASQGFVPPGARKAIEGLRALQGSGSVVDAVAFDITFHRSLVEGLGSPRLERLYASLVGELHLCVAQVQAHRLLDPVEVAAEHTKITDAIQCGDAEAAVNAVVEHLTHSRMELVENLRRRPQASAALEV